MNTPLNKITISCIVPTFNRASLLKKSIESTINQTFPYWELIIVDDGSADNTEEVVKKFKDDRIRYFKNPGKGGNAARNHGIKMASSDWLAFLDDDVVNLPHRFELQLKAAENSGADFIVSRYFSYNKHGKKILSPIEDMVGVGITSRWFIKRDLIIKAGLFDESMVAMQETELSYRIANLASFAFHLTPSTIEGRSINSVSSGLNGIKGRIQLIEKQKDNLPVLELIFWYTATALAYYREGDKQNAMKFITKATRIKYSGRLFWGLLFFRITSKLPSVFFKLNHKVLFFLIQKNIYKKSDHIRVE